jgi:hydroxyacyl-ACP dehydratase HTD2-like protein with hotdog domain
MWAGGSMKWHDTLHIGQRMKAKSTVTSAMKKGFEKGTPMVFVNQLIEYRKPKITEPLIVEERSHVYLPPGHNKREPREGRQSAFHYFFF